MTAYEQSKLMDGIRSMSELELQAFIEELTDHLYKNKMSHLIPDGEDQINNLHEELDDLQEEFSDYKRKVQNIIAQL